MKKTRTFLLEFFGVVALACVPIFNYFDDLDRVVISLGVAIYFKLMLIEDKVTKENEDE